MAPIGARERSWTGCMCQYCKPRTQAGTKDRATTRGWKRSEKQLARKRVAKEVDDERAE